MRKGHFICMLLLFILTACQQIADKKMSIAILTPVTHPSLEQIEKGFKETIENEYPKKFRFTTYNAQGNKTLMRSEVEEIIRAKPTLVFTLGTMASQMTAEVFFKKGISMPIVFTCVNDPVGFNIVPSEEHPGGHITGVRELLNFKEELNALLYYKPNLKNVLLVFNPLEPGLEKDQKEISFILSEQKIGLIKVEVFQTNELMAKVPPFMEKADALVVLKDNTVISGLDFLIKLCNMYHIPLMASDLDSPDRGAAFGYGVYERDFGVEAAKKALLIMSQNVKPGDIPVTAVSKFMLKINREAAELQGIHLHVEEKS